MIACNTSGQWQQALEVHREMRAGGHALNTTSYNALISAHSKSGHLDQVLATYRSMVEEVRPHIYSFVLPHHRRLHSSRTIPMKVHEPCGMPVPTAMQAKWHWPTQSEHPTPTLKGCSQ